MTFRNFSEKILAPSLREVSGILREFLVKNFAKISARVNGRVDRDIGRDPKFGAPYIPNRVIQSFGVDDDDSTGT